MHVERGQSYSRTDFRGWIGSGVNIQGVEAKRQASQAGLALSQRICEDWKLNDGD